MVSNFHFGVNFRIFFGGGERGRTRRSVAYGANFEENFAYTSSLRYKIVPCGKMTIKAMNVLYV